MRWENLSRVNLAPGFIAPCLPTVAAKVPMGPLWIHEVKHDGYRLLVRKTAGSRMGEAGQRKTIRRT
jgi:ATP-dependent DNA ligase